MWLLSTDRAELHYFPTPEDVSDSYATFSHVWTHSEQTFWDVRGIQNMCAEDDTNPRDFMSEKIRRCCQLAEIHGFKWVWIDTCCIDKTSGAELSEAINAMYRYYSLAGICYGFLRDVPHFHNTRHYEDHARIFLKSQWFRSGWTLQALIAPRHLVFLSRDWRVLGSKADFAGLLEKHIGIPATLLRLKVRHTDFSIDQRMSWCTDRDTTRPEDEAYCLLGLMDVQMQPLYGEGKNAFRRLLEGIVKQRPQTTLFARGGIKALEDDALPGPIHSTHNVTRVPGSLGSLDTRSLPPHPSFITVIDCSPVPPHCFGDSGMIHARFPIEICELIIDACCDEPIRFPHYDTLRACALSCSAWTIRSRWNLYRHVWLPSSHTADLLERTLRTLPHLGRFVRRLTVGRDGSESNLRRDDSSQCMTFARLIFLRLFENVRSLDFYTDILHDVPQYHCLLRSFPITELNLLLQWGGGKGRCSLRNNFRLIWSLLELRSCRIWVVGPQHDIYDYNRAIDMIEAVAAKRKELGVPKALCHITTLSLHFLAVTPTSMRFPPEGAFGRSIRHLELHFEASGSETWRLADFSPIIRCLSGLDDLRSLHLTPSLFPSRKQNLTAVSRILLPSFLAAIPSPSSFTCLSIDLDLGPSSSMNRLFDLFTAETKAALESFPKLPRFELRVVGHDGLQRFRQMLLSAKVRNWMPQLEHRVRVVTRT